MCERAPLPRGRRGFPTLALLALLVSGCLAAPAAAPAPPQTAAPSPTVTATPTVVWFPPTPTRTPRPTQAASTPTPPSGLPRGALILQDAFSSSAGAWLFTPAPGGRITVGGQEMTFTAQAVRAYLYSVRSQPLLQDFALQVQASLNLCQGQDEYGILLRFTPPNNFYRFSVSCQGETRLDRLYNGSATSPQPWMRSGNAPPGAPGRVRLGVLAQGKTLRFYLNGVLQFTVTDPFPAAGQIGLFIRTASDSPVSISFRDLQVWEAGE